MFVLSLHVSEVWEGARGVLAAKSGERLRRQDPCFSYVTMVTIKKKIYSMYLNFVCKIWF